MLTRRQALVSTVCAPLLRLPTAHDVRIISEGTLLSEESAAGYRLQTDLAPNRPLLVVAGLSRPSQQTLDHIHDELMRGSVVVLESGLSFSSREEIRKQSQRLSRHFSIDLHDQCITPARYITYTWPHPSSIRSFGPALGFNCAPENVIAHSDGSPVAFLKQYGRGKLAFLGAMLGPSLFAGDREAHELWRALCVRCAGRSFGGTSTRA